jgi:hypothetical protein
MGYEDNKKIADTIFDYIKNNNLSQAKSIIDTLDSDNLKNQDILCSVIRYHHKSMNNNKAEELYNSYTEEKEKGLYLTHAVTLNNLGRDKEALNITDWFYNQNKNDKQSAVTHAVTLQNLGRDEEVIKVIAELINNNQYLSQKDKIICEHINDFTLLAKKLRQIEEIKYNDRYVATILITGKDGNVEPKKINIGPKLFELSKEFNIKDIIQEHIQSPGRVLIHTSARDLRDRGDNSISFVNPLRILLIVNHLLAIR